MHPQSVEPPPVVSVTVWTSCPPLRYQGTEEELRRLQEVDPNAEVELIPSGGSRRDPVWVPVGRIKLLPKQNGGKSASPALAAV